MFKKLRVMYYRWCLRCIEYDLSILQGMLFDLELFIEDVRAIRDDIRELYIDKDRIIGKLKTLGVHVI